MCAHTALLSVLAFFNAQRVCYGKREAGSDLHVRRVLIDMAESHSTRRAAPADSQDPTLGIKKRAAPSV